MTPRTDDVLRAARAAGADGAVLTHPAHLRWAAGFTGSSGVLVVSAGAAHFVTDGRYDAQARAEVAGAEIHVPGYRLFEHVAENGLLGDARRVAVASSHTTLASFNRLVGLLPDVELIPLDDFLDAEIAVKTEEEIDRLRAAQALTCEVLESVLPMIVAGVAESDVAAELVYHHLKRGAERMSFEPIVASGPRGALPHARAGERRLERGDMVVIDVGGVLDGYSADLTRTVAVGEPGAEARRVYDVVLQAQRAGKAALTPGGAGRAADAAAREVIEAAGYGEAFTHSLGHGIGLETHEWPRLSRQADDVVPAGAAVTVEPGIYLKGRFGVRIEDVVVVRAGGAETLTPMGTDLVVL